MKKDCKKCGKSMCAASWTAWVLVIIGGLNWALVGIGMFASKNLNVVNLIFGKIMWLEAVIYILVGLAAVAIMCGCRCKKCCKGKCVDGKCESGAGACSACGCSPCKCGGGDSAVKEM